MVFGSPAALASEPAPPPADDAPAEPATDRPDAPDADSADADAADADAPEDDAPEDDAPETDLPELPAGAAPVVKAVRVEGIRRVDRTSVRSKIYSQVGRPLNRARVSDDVKRIYRLNFFEDVQVALVPDGNGVALVFKVSERPTILDIKYEVEGDAVDLDDIRKVVDLRRFAILDEAAVRFNLDKIEELYIEEGHFLVSTSYAVQRRPNNGVEIILKVDEGRKVEVRHVHIVGNRNVDADEIKGVLFTREGGLLSFLDQSGQFKREFFEQDIQRIQLMYLNKGFVQVAVDEPVVTLSPDKTSMSITIRVEEGPQYEVGDIDVTMAEGAEWLVPKEQLVARLGMLKGQTFDYTRMQQDIRRVGDVYRDLGYANANVSNDHTLDPDNKIVHFTYRIAPGDLVYFRRITIRGNTSTQDKVIRREMKIAEGELYNATRLRRSQERITVLGFFENVDVAPEQTDDPKRMDVVVKVKEKQTGTFQVGAGFSSLESFILTAQISKNNFLGRGQTVSAQITWSGIRQLFSVSFFEPYFFDSRWTFAFEVFNFQEDFVDFTRLRTGGNLSFGYRLTDDLSLSLTYTLESVDATFRSTDIDIKRLRQSGLTSSLRGTVSYDSRNNRLFPSKGNYTTLSVEHAAEWLGSENLFTRYQARTRFYFNPVFDWVLKFNTTLGYVVSGDDRPVPLFERFFVGGIFTVRGFERNSIGESLGIASLPGANLDPINIGGDKQLIFNAELEIPIFAEVGIRGVLFFDAGNAWGIDRSVDPFDLRTSLGFGFRWQSPVGPLRFEWGFPIDPAPGEDPVVFEFTIGNFF